MNAETVTNADVELKGNTITTTAASQRSLADSGPRSAHAPTESTRSAQNASQVYCLRSLRISAAGTSMTAAAAATAATRAVAREGHPMERVTT